MLFNSIEFLLLFLPVTAGVFFLLGRSSQRGAAASMLAASFFFYGWWNPAYVALLLVSIAFNFMVGCSLAKGNDIGSPRRSRLLALGVAVDLGLLAYFKYADFLIGSVNAVASTKWPALNVVLPLGISFFTFTQIAYLVDSSRGKASEVDPVHYGLFVTYFPHLIAGPVLHHKEMMPQFDLKETYSPQLQAITVGLTVFSIGLFKKVVLADGIAPYGKAAFAAAEAGQGLPLLDAWAGALAYTLQLYFDFSGYSDMAIGLSFVFGIKLPINFNSPYKARNIADFWRRWHMTLSRFLRDYLYIPLGGNRYGTTRRYVNLATTMVLGGLWHGAGWTFVVWGALHGAYLVVHQAWQALLDHFGWAGRTPTVVERVFATALTFVAVVVGWVFFRASSMSSAMSLLQGMFGGHGVSIPAALAARMGAVTPWLQAHGVALSGASGTEFVLAYVWILTLLPIVFFLPNSQQLMERFEPSLDGTAWSGSSRLVWRPSLPWAVFMSLALAAGLLSLTRPSEFLYFQF